MALGIGRMDFVLHVMYVCTYVHSLSSISSASDFSLVARALYV